MNDAPNASVVISRVTSNTTPDYIRIEVKVPGPRGDRARSRRILVELTPEDFAYALTGRAGTPCFVEEC